MRVARGLVLVAMAVVLAATTATAAAETATAAMAATAAAAPTAGAGTVDVETLAAGAGAGTLGTIDSFVDAAVETWRKSLDATSRLELAEISEKLSVALRSSSITLSGGISNQDGSGGGAPSGDRSDGERVSVRVPVTERISVTGSYDFDRETGSVKISYTLPKTWLAGAGAGSGGDDGGDGGAGVRGDAGTIERLLGALGPNAQARQAANMSVLEYRAAEASTRLAAQKAYINAIKSVKATAVAREELRLAEVALEIARRRREAGIAADSEVEQAAMKVLDCQIALARAENDERWMRLDLAEITGVDMSNATFADLPEFDMEVPELEALVEAALNNDLNLIKAHLELDSALSDLDAARSLLPAVSVDVQLSTGGSKPVVSASASWSLDGSRGLNIRRAEIAVERQRQAVEARRKAVVEEVQRSVEQLNLDLWSAEKWRSQLENAQKAYDEALKAYAEGDLLMVDLERAQLNLTTARNNYMANWGGVWQAWYSLMNYCGM